jgi:DNA processing protein
MPRNELAAWLRLLLTPGLGRSSSRQLLARFGLPEAVWEQPEAAWAQVLGPTLAAAMAQDIDGFENTLDAHQRWLDAHEDRHLITLGDPRYPPELVQTADPPLALFVHGRLDALAHPRRLAVVGSRNPTPQGTDNARAFAHTLARSGLSIVSGLALGVDGAAHDGALAAGGFTLAVVGTGLDRVYPSRHRALAHRIVAQGAMVSEYVLGTPPLAQNFPQRNRIISGLSAGTLVVEAALQSGSLITARMASEQGREVFAIPGSIHSTQSRGCHALIRQGAKLVESAQDVLEELQWAVDVASPDTARTDTVQPEANTDDADPVLAAMGHDPVSLDAIQARTGLDTARLQAHLLTLELGGQVARLPGGLLQRVAAG